MKKTIISIDPGEKGGIAFTDLEQIAAIKMPETEGDTLAQIRAIVASGGECVAFLEEVGGYIDGLGSGPAMFNFGRGFGFILGSLQAMGVRVELVRPQKWQKALGLGTKEKTRGDYSGMTDEQKSVEQKRVRSLNAKAKKDWKNKLKERAQQLHPTIEVTLSTADALLILEYGKGVVR
jgi:hypothetical protein